MSPGGGVIMRVGGAVGVQGGEHYVALDVSVRVIGQRCSVPRRNARDACGRGGACLGGRATWRDVGDEDADATKVDRNVTPSGSCCMHVMRRHGAGDLKRDDAGGSSDGVGHGNRLVVNAMANVGATVR